MQTTRKLLDALFKDKTRITNPEVIELLKAWAENEIYQEQNSLPQFKAILEKINQALYYRRRHGGETEGKDPELKNLILLKDKVLVKIIKTILGYSKRKLFSEYTHIAQFILFFEPIFYERKEKIMSQNLLTFQGFEAYEKRASEICATKI